MITEDYVSYETAKLLKEKGFNSNEISCINVFKGHTYKIQDTVIDADEDVTIPTIQLTMKWLRNIHGLFIHIDVIREASCWLVDIQDIKEDVNIYPVKNEFPNYEEACEAAIKYCLENLI